MPDTWRTFNDPVLDLLVEEAYAQNLPLQIAGIRVLEAQARRGVAIGSLFPQLQEGSGSFFRQTASASIANSPVDVPGFKDSFNTWGVGFDAGWELDVWGRFRRGIEAADADLIGSVFNYDDVLVSLIGEVATVYVQIRTLEALLEAVRFNVKIQERSLQISEVKFRNGTVTELDPSQARALLRDTESSVPSVEAAIRQAQNTLCVLLGIPPRDVEAMLQGVQPIPAAPPEVVIGIPAELLRRRPDIRRAERDVAAQSARIGVAVSDLYPRFTLIGALGIQAEDFVDLFEGRSFTAFGGPSFQWNILNYGRIRNNVRVQDAQFQGLVVNYENTVLRAQEEVESAIAGYLGARDQVGFLTSGVQAAERAVELANIQYRDGAVDYTRVLQTQEVLLSEQVSLVRAQGSGVINLIAMYKALGGGWELRTGDDFVPEATKAEMRARTNWGDLLEPADQEKQLEQAADSTEKETGWWRWWWPLW